MFSQILILSVLGCIAFANARSSPEVITCNASPEVVQRGETATITCHFPFDINQMTSVWVSVGLFPDNEPEREDELELVRCIKHNTPKPECKVLEEGYSIDSNVDTNLKLHISNISAQHSGRFICQVLHGGEDRGEKETPKPETCPLSVRKVVKCKTSPEQVRIGDNATVTCHFPDDVSQMSSVAMTVGHFPASEPGRKHSVSLVECTKTNRPEPECTVSKRYVIEGAVKTSLKLRIPNISAQHFGRFLCRMFPAEGEEIPISEMCSFSILGVTPVPPNSEVMVVTAAGVENNGVTPVPTKSEVMVVTAAGVENNGIDMEEETNSALIIGPVIGGVLLVVAAGILVILYRKGLLKRFQLNAGQKDSRGSPRHQKGSTLDTTFNTETVSYPLLGNTKPSENDPPVHPPHGDIPTTLLKCFQANAGQKDSRESPRHQGGSTLDTTVNMKTVCDPLLGNRKLSEDDPPVHLPHGDIPTTGGVEVVQTSTAEVSEENTVRLLLVGGNGTEHRTTGNTILGRECFKTDAKSATSDCEKHVKVRDNTRIEEIKSQEVLQEQQDMERQREMEELKRRAEERREPYLLEVVVDSVKSVATAVVKAYIPGFRE